jgi:hypothetical protein
VETETSLIALEATTVRRDCLTTKISANANATRWIHHACVWSGRLFNNRPIQIFMTIAMAIPQLASGGCNFATAYIYAWLASSSSSPTIPNRAETSIDTSCSLRFKLIGADLIKFNLDPIYLHVFQRISFLFLKSYSFQLKKVYAKLLGIFF